MSYRSLNVIGVVAFINYSKCFFMHNQIQGTFLHWREYLNVYFIVDPVLLMTPLKEKCVFGSLCQSCDEKSEREDEISHHKVLE